ncbi:MAG: HAMP domain-containing histidine kinase [Nocardiaceae bacterium]|nr:HAMP domain-containing histidine kinase [Nocardiaceae bacterium]
MRSRLRTRVIALAVGTALLVIVLAAVPIVILLHNKAYAEAEQRATFAAQSAADYLSTGEHSAELLEPFVQRLNDRNDPPVTVVLPGGRRSGAPLAPGVSAAVDAVSGPRMDADHDRDTLDEVSNPYTTAVPGGRAVQVFTRTPTGAARAVAVVTDASVRARLARQYAVAGAIAAVLLLLAWIAAEVTGRRLVRPLQRAARTATALRDGDLSARAPVEGPEEVAAVAIELNALAARIGELLTQEREAAADLSHRLRTPLTSVRLSVEGLPDGPQRAELEAGLDRLERTLTQIIRAARRGVREGIHPRCDAAQVARERVAFWQPLAEDQERALSVDVPGGPIWVRSTADDLGAALDALIENVVAHTPDGTAFAVVLRPASYGADIVVSDEGGGISPDALARGTSDRGSSGLGLDIARSVAEATGGGLDLIDADADGLAHGIALRLHDDRPRPTRGEPAEPEPQRNLR